MSTIRARAFVAQIELSLAGVCLACLSFVAFPLDDGDEREVARQLRVMTPDLWADGLDVQAFAAVRGACGRGVRDGPAALAELESLGPRSVIAREIVRRLAFELVNRTRTEMQLEARAQPRLELAPPELN
jgi:hypothetical protein